MLDRIVDDRVQCTSIMLTIPVGAYLALVDTVYQNRGGIEGQRAPLKTKTAIKIRRRLVDDLKRGAVVPPIVIGAVIAPEELAVLDQSDNSSEALEFFKRVDTEKLSIIDGMQRTTALKEAALADETLLVRL